jgi:hypothetical protein
MDKLTISLGGLSVEVDFSEARRLPHQLMWDRYIKPAMLQLMFSDQPVDELTMSAMNHFDSDEKD